MGVRTFTTERQQSLVVLVDLAAHCNIPRRRKDFVMGLLNRCLAVFVKSTYLALPFDVVSVVAGRAALDPILKCFAVNACFASCVGQDGIFPEAVEDKPHALRRKLWAGFRDIRWQFLLLDSAAAAATSFAAHRPEWGCLCFRSLGPASLMAALAGGRCSALVVLFVTVAVTDLGGDAPEVLARSALSLTDSSSTESRCTGRSPAISTGVSSWTGATGAILAS